MLNFSVFVHPKGVVGWSNRLPACSGWLTGRWLSTVAGILAFGLAWFVYARVYRVLFTGGMVGTGALLQSWRDVGAPAVGRAFT